MLQFKLCLSILAILIVTPNINGQSIAQGFLRILSEGGRQTIVEPKDESNLLSEYDFIVVGAGTAGCVIANRLSENSDWKILLLEAGGPENYVMDLPVLVNYLQFTEANWKHKTEPSNDFCLGFDGQQCKWPRGRVMGGSSVLNYMIYTRGNKRDYDNWAQLGNNGWSFDDVLPYFKKIENFVVPEYENSSYHAKGGPVTIGYAPYKTKIADAIIEASQQNGLPYVDYNGATNVGVSRLQVNMKNGVRDSSSRAYLQPISNRANLHVKKYATVSRVLINPTTKQAYGVEFATNGMMKAIFASKEVILCAGAINSPQILMLSGVGPKKHLNQVGVPFIKHLRVGYNLMDHIALGGLTFMINKPYSIRLERLTSNENLRQYFNYHLGPLTIPGGCEVIILTELGKPNDPDGYPDMELLYQGGSLVADVVLRRNFGITDEIYDAVFKPIEKKESFMVFPLLLRTKTRGRIMLKSKNFRSKPRIFPNYFAHREDIEKLIGGVRLAINITKQPALQELGAKIHDIPIPQCAHHGFGSDNYFECMMRHFSFTNYHPSGTCKMGPITDKQAVVDPRLRVYGIKGLRVIDASIMPVIPSAHTNGPTFMIAEKGVDMIKEDWNYERNT